MLLVEMSEDLAAQGRWHSRHAVRHRFADDQRPVGVWRPRPNAGGQRGKPHGRGRTSAGCIGSFEVLELLQEVLQWRRRRGRRADAAK